MFPVFPVLAVDGGGVVPSHTTSGDVVVVFELTAGGAVVSGVATGVVDSKETAEGRVGEAEGTDERRVVVAAVDGAGVVVAGAGGFAAVPAVVPKASVSISFSVVSMYSLKCPVLKFTALPE